MVQKDTKKLSKSFFIIAGEASGDLLGAKLIKELKDQLKAAKQPAKFIGVGGKMMQEEGLQSIFDIKELSLMGFAEIVPHIPRLLRRINQTAQEIIKQKPDFVITIDAPDFNFRVIKKLQKLTPENAAKKIHLIAPSVWAYREGRAKKIAKLYDLLLAILPFEPPYFTKHGLKTVFIGHPIVENAPDLTQKEKIRQNFRRKHKIKKDDTLIIVTAGSRNGEVKKIFPQFIKAINLIKNDEIKIAIPLTEKTQELVKSMAQELKTDCIFIESNEKNSAFLAADFALAKSGTNNLEISLCKLPMIIAYKVNFLTYIIVKMLVKIKFANLINLILNKEVIPEMLQQNCEGEKIAIKLKELIDKKELTQKQIKESTAALKILGLGSKSTPSRKAAKEILKLT